MSRPATKLPDPKQATQEQIASELIALSDWAKYNGFHNVMYRLNWVLRAVSEKHDLQKPSEG